MSDFTPSPPPAPEPGEGTKLFGALLMAVGVLIATLCGLCSLVVGGAMIVGSIEQLSKADRTGPGLHGPLQTLWLIGIFGGVPIAVGVALFFVGLRLKRGR